MKTLLFIILTWGLGLLLPVVAFFAIRHIWPNAGLVIPVAIAAAVFLCFIIVGEWWARFVGLFVYRKQKETDGTR